MEGSLGVTAGEEEPLKTETKRKKKKAGEWRIGS